VAWVTGGRDAKTFRRLYDKVKHLKSCVFYTDDWEAFAKVLPPERHVVGKAGTVAIERDNSNTRHHLGRMTRRTKVVSKKEFMVNASLKLWLALTNPPPSYSTSRNIYVSLSKHSRFFIKVWWLCLIFFGGAPLTVTLSLFKINIAPSHQLIRVEFPQLMSDSVETDFRAV
jgi:insertion element IS1 protein InsB